MGQAEDRAREAIEQALDEYIGDDFRVQDVLHAYDGSYAKLGRAIAAYQGKPFTSGNQDKAVRRWIAYENGSRDRNKARNPDKDPSTKQMLRALYRKKVRPQRVKTTISGLIKVSNDKRDRTVDIDPDRNPSIDDIDVDRLMEAYERDDMEGALEAMFDAYCPGMSAESIDDMDVWFE